MSTTSSARTRAPVLRGLQVTSGLAVLSLLFQFITAGRLFSRGAPEGLHAGGAVVLHVLTGAAAVAAVLLWRRGGSPAWPAALAVVTFLLTFVQAALGGRDTLWIHVPGAMVLTVGVVWLATWSFTGAHRAHTTSDSELSPARRPPSTTATPRPARR